MPTTIDELPDAQKIDLFRAMVQTGAIVAAGLPGPDNDDPVNKAMAAVEMAATITLEDLLIAGVDPAAAAYGLFYWHFGRADKPEWLGHE
jgi:hypothetical protein